jgi:hypothetical protein
MNKLFEDHCFRELDAYPTEACPLALKAIEAIKHGESDTVPGACPWHCPDASCHYCFWILCNREAPIEDEEIKRKAEAIEDPARQQAELRKELSLSATRIGQLLDIPKKEVLALLASATSKLRAKGLDSTLIREWLGAVEDTSRPLDPSIYCQLFEETEDYNPEKRPDYDPELDFDPELTDGDLQRKEMFVQRDAQGNVIMQEDDSGKEAPRDPTKPRRGRPPKRQMRGFSGAAARHYSGKRTQLYALSQNWSKVAKAFAEAGSPITMCEYTLHQEAKATPEEKEKDKKKKKTSQKMPPRDIK